MEQVSLSCLALGKPADLEVSIPAGILMVSEEDMAGDFLSETRVFPEFGLLYTVHDHRASAFIVEYLPAIKPVFAMVAAHKDS